MDHMLARMNLVRREEFDTVQAMAAKARREQEALAARLTALEAKLGFPAGKTAPTRPRRRAAARQKSR